ncbi:molybdenum-pterin binding domain-containing protein [Persephonella hydrogeniphila]|uniref:Molybdenum-pterin binding domain-containing protein n=1 Tax=Persephonella hydrogeniphila TaxID=198703 RepID=A0A285NMB1_9AQUI|nr:TOBE domain-containing protein [Persephonella hydrogeniphila]SNZ10063.1 molybdenum-pterin binding domain-containing protein [Persephonella hydrogeniphila]
MNKIRGIIVNIESSENVSLVEVDTPVGKICSVVIETPETADYLKKGNEVYVLFKETEVSVGKNFSGEISLRNRVECIVKEIQKGKILSRIVLQSDGEDIVSVITTRSAERMNIQKGDNVTAFIKTNEVSLMEIVNGQ